MGKGVTSALMRLSVERRFFGIKRWHLAQGFIYLSLNLDTTLSISPWNQVECVSFFTNELYRKKIKNKKSSYSVRKSCKGSYLSDSLHGCFIIIINFRMQ